MYTSASVRLLEDLCYMAKKLSPGPTKAEKRTEEVNTLIDDLIDT